MLIRNIIFALSISDESPMSIILKSGRCPLFLRYKDFCKTGLAVLPCLDVGKITIGEQEPVGVAHFLVIFRIFWQILSVMLQR